MIKKIALALGLIISAGCVAESVTPALVELNDIPGDTKILTNAVEYINSVAGGGGGGGADMGAVTGVVNDAIAEFSRTNAVLSGGPYTSTTYVDSNFLNLNADENQGINQHPGFYNGFDVYGIVYFGGGTYVYLGNDGLLSLPAANTELGLPEAQFILHGANLQGGESGVIQTTTEPLYAMVMPGEWTFSGETSSYGWSIKFEYGYWDLFDNPNEPPASSMEGTENDLVVSFSIGVTATRESLPGHLIDRSINLITVSYETNLFLPTIVTNKSRDFIVNMIISGGPQSVTFTNLTDEVLTWAKDSPPSTFDAGTNIIRFTEVAQSCFLYQKLPADSGGGGGGGEVSYITDGTNTIDAAGNVWTNFIGWTFSDGESHAVYKIYDPEYSPESPWGLYIDTTDLGHGISWYATEEARDNATRFTDDRFNPPITATYHDGPIYAGKLALTNDIPQVVAPSTNAVAGQAADAKATSTALYTGFTEWELSSANTDPLPDGIVFSMAYNSTDGEWILSYTYGGQSNSLRKEGSIDDTFVVFDLFDTPVFKTTRHLVTPTKTSQIVNDGSNGIPFFVSSGGTINGNVTMFGTFAQGCAGVNASGLCAHAEGTNTTASGMFSHAEGSSTTASGNYSHAEGNLSKATGAYSHAQGYNTKASGSASSAFGITSHAYGRASFAAGANANATNDLSFVWSSKDSGSSSSFYTSHGVGTFNINPTNGFDGVFIGETSLSAIKPFVFTNVSVVGETPAYFVTIPPRTIGYAALSDDATIVIDVGHGDPNVSRECKLVMVTGTSPTISWDESKFYTNVQFTDDSTNILSFTEIMPNKFIVTKQVLGVNQ